MKTRRYLYNDDNRRRFFVSFFVSLWTSLFTKMVANKKKYEQTVQITQDCGYCIRLHPWHRSSLYQRRLDHSGRHLQSSDPVLCSARRGDSFVPRTRTLLGWRSFRVVAPTVRSTLSLHRSSPSKFSAGLKPHLFNQAYTVAYTSLFTSHHMEKTEEGLKGLCIREIMTEYTLYYTKYYTIILRFPMPWRSAL